MLIDQAKIYVSGGSGGKGCQSLYKDKYERRGIPDGGDGGAGGDVIIQSSTNLQTPLDFKYNQHHTAGNGKHGGSNNKTGARGHDVVLLVPVGTIVIDKANGLVIRDLAFAGEKVIVAKGGAGGIGSLKSRTASDGKPGDEKTLFLELKLVADAGIIGFPNAGKSTLVSCVSKAHTKIAPYPFTTKSPKLGVVKFYDNSFVIADMPGLIEGAHAGKGLGDLFLRHIERTSVLVHLVDMAPLDGVEPYETYRILEKELKLYGAGVHDKPRIIVASKMDMPGAKENLKVFRKKVRKKVFPISAVKNEGLGDLVKTMYEEIKNVKSEI